MHDIWDSIRAEHGNQLHRDREQHRGVFLSDDHDHGQWYRACHLVRRKSDRFQAVTFVHNTEELAGTLCHETSHLLHRDSVNLMKRDQAIRGRAIAATILLGPSIGMALAMTVFTLTMRRRIWEIPDQYQIFPTSS